MSEWKGASKGSLLGYKIFVFFIHNIGLRFSYFILFFVALYYFLFSWSSSKSIYYYLRKRQGFSVIKSIIGIYRSYYVFGQTLIDRMLISSGKKNRFTYEFDGIEKIKGVINKGDGAVLISAHVGNFEISEYFLEDLDENLITNIVTTDLERKKIKDYLEKLSVESRMKYILIKEDMSHIYQFNEALSKNEFICITGDRYLPGSKYLEAEFLGEKARFPAGPFMIGSRLKVPVVFVYVMKESATHYHLYARVVDVKHRDSKGLLDSYVKSITSIVDKYPYQWFNYFHFWNKPNDE
ncbi:MAG TPA: hypothetical protein VKY37_13370 [Brumimicrobium sp.]|nr:hypothetical protein [Brumimicrobium sp.]